MSTWWLHIAFTNVSFDQDCDDMYIHLYDSFTVASTQLKMIRLKSPYIPCFHWHYLLLETKPNPRGYDCERIDVSWWSMHAAPMELRGRKCFIQYAVCETALRYTHHIRASRGAAMLSRQVCARKTYAWPCLSISPASSLSKIYISHSRQILTVYCWLSAGCVVCNILAKTNIDVIRACIVATKIPV